MDGWLLTLPTVKAQREMLFKDEMTIEISARLNTILMGGFVCLQMLVSTLRVVL